MPGLRIEIVYPGAAASTPHAAADELADVFEVLDEWTDRGRTMLRLVWRGSASEPEVSVSLVDGRTLDSWGRTLK